MLLGGGGDPPPPPVFDGEPYLAHHFLAASIPPTPKAMARARVADPMMMVTITQHHLVTVGCPHNSL